MWDAGEENWRDAVLEYCRANDEQLLTLDPLVARVAKSMDVKCSYVVLGPPLQLESQS